MKIQFVKRQNSAHKNPALTMVVCVICFLGVLALLFLAAKANPVKAVKLMLSAPFESGYAFSEVLVRTTPVIFTGLAVAVCLRMKLWNIGAEGQMYMGALGAVWAAQNFSELSTVPLLLLMMFAGMVASGFAGFLPGILKKQLGVSEVLTSLMFTYIVGSLVNLLIYGPWQDPAAFGFPTTPRFVQAAWLPQFFGTRLHLGFFLSLATAAFMWFLFKKTKWGYEVSATGESLGAAEYAGMSIGRNVVLVFILSGMLAGIGGFCEVSGIHHKLQEGSISGSYANLGVIAAWLANANPFGVIVTAFFCGVLLVGADAIQVRMGVTTDMVQILMGLLMCGILCAKFFKEYTMVIHRGGGTAA